MAPFSSDIGVTAFESSAYGKCFCASKYDDKTNGFRSFPGIPNRPRPFRIVNYLSTQIGKTNCEKKWIKENENEYFCFLLLDHSEN